MNLVLISSESRYPINRRRIKKVVSDYLESLGIEGAEVSIAIVGSRKIRELNKKWRNLDETTAVLSFGLEEPRDKEGILRIGDIVISYPEARLIAQEENLSMDETIDKLLIHGLKNLLNQKNDNQFLSQVSSSDLSGTG